MCALFTALICGCGKERGIEQVLSQYESRTMGLDSKGTLYRVKDYRLSFSEDNGKTWTESGAIPSRGYAVWGHSLACGEEGVFYFAQIGTGKGKKAVYVSKSVDGGMTWTPPTVANDDVWAQRVHPRIVVKGREVFAVWQELTQRSPTGEGRPSGVYFSGSFDGGMSWTEDTWIRGGEDVWITIGEDGIIYLTYLGGDRHNIIYLSYSEDKGRSWNSETTGELGLIVVKEPYAISVGGCVYLFFQTTKLTSIHLVPGAKLDYEMYYLETDDKGKSWSRMISLDRGEER